MKQWCKMGHGANELPGSKLCQPRPMHKPLTFNPSQSLWDAVGNTPLIRIESLSRLTGCEIFGKAEFMNPGGSIKDRAAKFMIAGAVEREQLRPGGTIVEGTAGNTGIGLAMLGRERGYRVVVTMPDNQAQEKYELLAAMGAVIHKVPVVPFSNQQHFFHAARRLSEEPQHVAQWYWANQFENLDNRDAHFTTTGPEIFAQAHGKIDVFLSGVGTGGTIAGVGCYLKQRDARIRVIAIDPAGSGIFSYVKTGVLSSQGSSITEGIGIMRLTANFTSAIIDDAVQCSDQAMIEMLYHLAAEDGLVVGTSAALNVRAAYDLAMQHRGSGMRIVTILCDHGSRYTSKIFNPAFLQSKGLVVRGLSAEATQ
jgi:cysteine synthase